MDGKGGSSIARLFVVFAYLCIDDILKRYGQVGTSEFKKEDKKVKERNVVAARACCYHGIHLVPPDRYYFSCLDETFLCLFLILYI